MFKQTITGKTEELAITITKSCQAIALTTNATDFKDENIEITLVDFNTGVETPLVRKNKIKLYSEIATQGGATRRFGTSIIEVGDCAMLYLDANRVLRINLTGLISDIKYEIMTIEAPNTGAQPISYEQLIIANGVTNQKFPISSGNLLVLPKANLQDFRVLYSDGTEVRRTAKEQSIYADNTNGIIALDPATSQMTLGSDSIFCIDLIETNDKDEVSKKVTEIEINLTESNGYTMYKCVNLNKPGFDHRF